MTEPLRDDRQALARDWITLWHSELAAMAQDREAQEGWQALVGLWAGAAHAMLPMLLAWQPPDAAGPRADAAPRPAPAAAAPDARDLEIGQLAARVAELERRLAELGSSSPA